jgi:hypothetical protein
MLSASEVEIAVKAASCLPMRMSPPEDFRTAKFFSLVGNYGAI